MRPIFASAGPNASDDVPFVADAVRKVHLTGAAQSQRGACILGSHLESR